MSEDLNKITTGGIRQEKYSFGEGWIIGIIHYYRSLCTNSYYFTLERRIQRVRGTWSNP